MEPHVSLITLGVSNLERAVTFYRDGLGLPMREGDSEVAFFQLRGVWLALFSRDALAEDAGVSSAGQGFAGFTLAHNVRTSEEVDTLLGQAVAAGGCWSKLEALPRGAGTRVISPTLMDISGKSPSIPKSLKSLGVPKVVVGCLHVQFRMRALRL